MVTANVVRMYIVLWTTRRSTWSQPKSGWLSFKIGWPPMVWLVGQICWWRQRTEEREGGNTSGSCLAGPACQSGNCLAGSAGQFVGSASQMSNSMASHTKYSKSVPSWIASLYGPFSSLPTLLQFSQCSLPSICGGPPSGRDPTCCGCRLGQIPSTRNHNWSKKFGCNFCTFRNAPCKPAHRKHGSLHWMGFYTSSTLCIAAETPVCD